MKTICAVGLKILAAGLAGVAVFIGIGQLSKNKSQESDSVNNDSNDFNNESSEVSNSLENVTKGDKIVDNLRKVQDTCSKVFTVIQSLTVVADNLSRVFGKRTTVGYTQPYFGRDPWSYNQPIDMGNGQVWNRISPYIIEVPPTRDCNRSPYSI